MILTAEMCRAVRSDPAIVTREFAAKRQQEVFERELMSVLTSVHVENSGQRLGSNQPICAHFTAKNCSDQLRHSWSGLLQEAPSSGARAVAPESILGTVRLVEVVLKPGSRACPPLATPIAEPGA
jgi:hypothetical protein